jgi:hypothetical protein
MAGVVRVGREVCRDGKAKPLGDAAFGLKRADPRIDDMVAHKDAVRV